VDLVYRSAFTLDEVEGGFVPLPPEAILEVQPVYEVEGSRIRDIVYDLSEPWAVLVDVRPLSDRCSWLEFGMQVVGDEAENVHGFIDAGGPEGTPWTWPAGEPPHLEVDIQGDVTVEQDGDRYEVTVVVDSEEPNEVALRFMTSPREGQSAPTVGCWNPERDEGPERPELQTGDRVREVVSTSALTAKIGRVPVH